MKLLIIRPQPGANVTAERAKKLAMEPFVMPLFAVSPVKWSANDAVHYDALLLTSANAVRHGGEDLQKYKRLPAYAVGNATAKAAASAGFLVKETGEKGGASLLDLARRNNHLRLLWPTGKHHIRLQPPIGMTIDTQITYESLAYNVPDDFALYLSRSDVVMLHSPRAAQYFAECCDKKHIDRTQINIAALSENIAAAAGGGWGRTLVAQRPDDDVLLSAIATSFTNAPRSP